MTEPKNADKITTMLKNARGWTVDQSARSDAYAAAYNRVLDAGGTHEVAGSYASYCAAYAGITAPVVDPAP